VNISSGCAVAPGERAFPAWRTRIIACPARALRSADHRAPLAVSGRRKSTRSSGLVPGRARRTRGAECLINGRLAGTRRAPVYPPRKRCTTQGPRVQVCDASAVAPFRQWPAPAVVRQSIQPDGVQDSHAHAPHLPCGAPYLRRYSSEVAPTVLNIRHPRIAQTRESQVQEKRMEYVR